MTFNNVIKVDFIPKMNTYKNEKTCKNCVLYDAYTKACGVFDGVDTTKLQTAIKCNSFIFSERDDTTNSVHWNEVDTHLTEDEYKFTVVEEEFTADIDQDFFFELQGTKKMENPKYPLEADIPANRDDAIWYVAPDESFGCWIINNHTKRFVTTENLPRIDKNTRIYKSPYPLHDHKASKGLQHYMCWYVDKNGEGQFSLLINKKVSFLSEK
ncbi:hypothetical protein [Bacillus sp. SM2101]|uniref:hypothetical protein n=1 Tax=Bacillus sp. SM2101 TaxID=2805366 RepID=UPI001BDDFC7A|nr:hypothetical protein [Bacillus sp. SM2101]